jgi:prepilin signal peptidase PulO-like enzyme (type II secretory pathway)
VFYLLSFILGASIGSFTQVIATRLQVAPIIKGRSKCLSCGEALRASDLIPIVSYFLLRGRCRYCKTPYGISAVIIEAIFGLTFVLLYHIILRDAPTFLLSSWWLVYYTVLFIVLGVMALYDRAHSFIPISFLSTFLFLTCVMFGIRLTFSFSIETLVAPLVVALPFFLVWLVTKGKGVGFGDVILFFGIGAFFGIYEGLAVFILSVWMGAVAGLYYKYVIAKNKKKATAMPFVPFIVSAFLIVLFTGVDIFSIAFLFS